jgi:hypothetical protein
MTYLLGLDAVRIATKRTIGLLREAPRLKRLLETGRVEKEYLERLCWPPPRPPPDMSRR